MQGPYRQSQFAGFANRTTCRGLSNPCAFQGFGNPKLIKGSGRPGEVWQVGPNSKSFLRPFCGKKIHHDFERPATRTRLLYFTKLSSCVSGSKHLMLIFLAWSCSCALQITSCQLGCQNSMAYIPVSTGSGCIHSGEPSIDQPWKVHEPSLGSGSRPWAEYLSWHDMHKY